MKAQKLFIKSSLTTLLAISVIISSLLGVKAIFNYLLSLHTSNISIGQLELDVLSVNDETSLKESTLIWKDSNNKDVDIISYGETYHLDEFVVLNTGNIPCKTSIKIECDNNEILNNFDITISPNNVYLEPNSSRSINVSLKLKDEVSNDIQGTTLSNIKVVFEAIDDNVIDYDD